MVVQTVIIDFTHVLLSAVQDFTLVAIETNLCVACLSSSTLRNL